MVGRRGKHASTTDPEYETRMMLAINDLRTRTYTTAIAAATAHNRTHFAPYLPYDTPTHIDLQGNDGSD